MVQGLVTKSDAPAALAYDDALLRRPLDEDRRLDDVDELGGDLRLDLHQAGPGPHRPTTPEVAVELLTSGTTGLPKRVPIPWRTVNLAMRDAKAHGQITLALVNVAAVFVLLLSIVPVYIAQRLSSDTSGVTSR